MIGAGPATDPQATAKVRRACLLLLLFGAVLRGTGLGVHSLWFDELMTVWVAQQPDLTRALAADRNPPLAFLLFSVWMRLFGEHDVVVRLLPALFSTATLTIAAVALPRLLPPRAAVVAVALLAVSPFSVWYGQEVRAYFLVELGAVVCSVGLVHLLQPAARLAPALSGCAFGIFVAFGAHYTGGYLLLSVLAAAGIVGRAHGWRRAAGAIAAGAAGLLPWVVWVVTLLPRQAENEWGFAPRPGLRDLLEAPGRLLLVEADTLPVALAWVPYAALALVAAALLVAAVRAFRPDGLLARACLAMAALPIAASFVVSLLVVPAFGARYLIAAEPALLLTIAVGCASMPARLGRLVGAGLVVLLAVVTVSHKTANLREDHRAAAEHLAAVWQPGDHVASLTGTFDGFSQAPLLHYLRDQPEILGSMLLEGQLLDPPPGVERLHLVFREAPYSWPRFQQLDTVWTVVSKEPMRLRVQYLLLQRRRG